MQPLFSADSHVVEPEEAFADIDPKFRDRRPQAVDDPEQGALMIVPGLDFQIHTVANLL